MIATGQADACPPFFVDMVKIVACFDVEIGVLTKTSQTQTALPSPVKV